jgi:DNA-binding transcriptional regulator YiaG
MGVSHTTVLRWADGTITPTGDALLRLHAATGGLVTPNDMLGVEVAA